MAQVLLCGHCGGPLPRPQVGGRFLTCRFCDATSDLETRTHQLQGTPQFVPAKERFPSEFTAFELQLVHGTGAASVADFRAAAEATLSTIADPVALTNVAFGIAADFDARNKGSNVAADRLALGRIAIAYLDSLQQLANASSCTINLPFLTATPQAPLHFIQEVTMDRLQQLAATQPPVAPPV